MDEKSKKSGTNSNNTKTATTHKPTGTTSNTTANTGAHSSSSHKHKHTPNEDDDYYLNNDDDELDDYEDEEEEEFDDYMDEDTEDQDDAYTNNRSVTDAKDISQPSTSLNSTSLDSNKKLDDANLSTSQRSALAALNPNKSKRNIEIDDEFKYEVLTPDKIVNHMIECIKEVNQVLELPPTTTRILLHHFRWDKEKLMERFYDGDQDRLFKEAHIVSPFKNSSSSRKVNHLMN